MLMFDRGEDLSVVGGQFIPNLNIFIQKIHTNIMYYKAIEPGLGSKCPRTNTQLAPFVNEDYKSDSTDRVRQW